MSIHSGGGSAGPRNLRVLDDDTLIFSVGPRLMLWDGQTAQALPQENDSEVVALLPAERHVLAVCEDGTILELDRATRQVVSQQRRSARVRSAALLPWLGGHRLLTAGDEGAVQCVGLEDTLLTQYVGPYRGLRALAASVAWVVGISPDRQRLVMWNTWDGLRPAHEIYVSALTRHRLADVAFA